LPNPDDILKDKLREGNIEVYKTLFETFYNQLISYGISITHDKEVSRGLTQDLFLKLWENRKKTVISGSIKAYLFTALNHLSVNWLRHEKVQRAFENASLHEVLAGIELPPRISPFLNEAVKTAIDALPDKAREVFTLTQLDGIPHKEVSRSLGISVKTIENQLSRSRKILKKRLRKYL